MGSRSPWNQSKRAVKCVNAGALGWRYGRKVLEGKGDLIEYWV